MQKPIVVVGSINLDLVVAADRIPKLGETIIGNSFHTFHGGKGANQAVAVAKLEYPVSMVGNVGSDAFGAQLRKGLEDAGVETSCVNTVEGPSGVALITIGRGGENNIVLVPGANAQLTPETVGKSDDASGTRRTSSGAMLGECVSTKKTGRYSRRCYPQDGSNWRGSRVRSSDCVGFHRLTCCCVC